MTAIERRTGPARRLEWQRAKVRQVVVETSRVKSLLLQINGWQGHLPGQHVDIRLTAKDGYQAQRSYSIASPPEDEIVTLTVERVENGEVSPYLVEELRCGDQFELRGPIGGYFVWTIAIGGPLCLISAGSGIAPFMAMLRHRDRRNSRVPTVLLYSSRSLEDAIYRKELDAMARGDSDLRVVGTLTRKQPDGWPEGLTSRCWPRRAFHPTEIQRYMSVAPCLSWRISRASWWSSDMTLSRSRPSDSDPREDRRND